jgi:hypothetical protein
VSCGALALRHFAQHFARAAFCAIFNSIASIAKIALTGEDIEMHGFVIGRSDKSAEC